jgi:hypothetical protein
LKSGERRLPSCIPLNWAARNVVIVVVDQVLFEHRDEWNNCINALAADANPDRDLILPLSVQADAARVTAAFDDVNHIVARNPGGLVEDDKIFQAVYTAMLRLLVPALPRVFLCHAKADGSGIARRVRRYLYEETQLSSFFDLHDVPHGHQVRKSIEESIRDSVLLVIWTDRLLDSPWCQMEIIEARRQQRPLLLLDALATTTPRLFPFLGNMPVVRWRRDPSPVVSAILLELIRTYHLQAVFESRRERRPGVPSFCLHPPDLLDSSFERTTAITSNENRLASEELPDPDLWVYPDPPLKSVELEVLRELVPRKRFLSLFEWQALRAADALDTDWDDKVSVRPDPLRGLRVGISVSASDTWIDMGLMGEHQGELSFQIALMLILLGTKLVWGGDLRPDGFGGQLKWIVQAYQHPTRAPQDHVAMVVPYTLTPEMRLDASAIKARRAFAQVRLMPSPVTSEPPDPASIEGRALAALALSAMRSELALGCDARIVLGGGVSKFQGLYPGIAEEAYETVRSDRPLYVVGGFGGAARAVYEAIADPRSPGAEQLVEAARTVGAAASEEARRVHAALVASAKVPDLAFAPERMIAAFSDLGPEGLARCNGLSIDENDRLSKSQDVDEVLTLIVKGMVEVKTRL